MVLLWIVATAVPFFLSILFTSIMIRLAPQMGLVDHPTSRKAHQRVVPLGGGLAVFAAVMLPTITVVAAAWLVVHRGYTFGLSQNLLIHAPGVLARTQELGWLALAGLVQLLVGFSDDFRRGGLDYRVRLGIEVLLVGWLISQGVVLKVAFLPAWMSGVVTVLWIVGLTNAINFLDNMDGLAAGVAAIACAFFATVMSLVGSLFVSACFLVLLGALLGFLRYNWSPAKIFMGDAGSNFVGFWLGILTVVGTFVIVPYSPVTVFAPLCILAVPIYDSLSVIVLRLAQGKSPFEADRQHFSHRLVMMGLLPARAVLVIYLVTITTGLSGVLLYYLAPPMAGWVAPLVVLQIGCMLGVIALLEVTVHKRGNGAPPMDSNRPAVSSASKPQPPAAETWPT